MRFHDSRCTSIFTCVSSICTCIQFLVTINYIYLLQKSWPTNDIDRWYYFYLYWFYKSEVYCPEKIGTLFQFKKFTKVVLFHFKLSGESFLLPVSTVPSFVERIDKSSRSGSFIFSATWLTEVYLSISWVLQDFLGPLWKVPWVVYGNRGLVK